MAIPFFRGFLGLLFSICALLLRQTVAENDADPDDFLRPLSPDILHDINPSFAAKRSPNDLSVLDLLESDVYIWGNPPEDGSDFLAANMTLYSGDNERIISLERFSRLLKSVECGEKMTLTFNDKASFQYAIKSWGWVNDEESHKFILVSDHSACAPKDERAPFLIYDVDYEEENAVAYLFGDKKEWEEVAHDMDLVTGHISFGGNKRGLGDWVADLGFSMEHPFNKPIVEEDDWGLDCTNCGTKGRFSAPLTIRIRWFSLEEFSLKVTPDNVGADLEVEYSRRISAEPLSFVYAPCLLKIPIPIPGTIIPGVLGLQASFQIFASIAVMGMAAETTIKTGISARVPRDAIAYVDLANSDKNEFSGWGLEFDHKPVDATSFKVKGAVSIGPVFYLSIGAQLFGWGVEAGIHLKPDVTLSIDGLGTKGTTCPTRHEEGLSFAISLSAAIFFTVGISGKSNFAVMYGPHPEPLWEPFGKRSIDAGDSIAERSVEEKSLIPRGKFSCAAQSSSNAKKAPVGPSLVLTLVDFPDWVLFETCIGGSPKDTDPKPSPSQSPNPTSTGPKPTGKACEVSGKKGVCMNIKEKCPDGHFDPGKGPNWPCPGDNNMQCCIPGKKEPELCNVGGGRVGKCQDIKTTPCPDGYYDAGVPPDWPCPGGDNIQCCVQGQGEKPPEPVRCEVSGRHGTCKNKKDGCPRGYFDPGKGPDWPCPGDANMQCCIPGFTGPPKPSTPQKPDGKCQAPEGAGQCGDVKYCRGISHTEPLCPNSPANIQCCVEQPCSGVDPISLPWQNPPPKLHGVCKRASDGCTNKDPPLPLGETQYKFLEPVGRDFLCPGDASIKCCVRMDGRKVV